MSTNKNNRILYIDLLRAFAVIMMIQGHTVDTFLADEYRSMDSTGYSIWFTLRGFTAPIFMFAAGLIFTYLLRADTFTFLSNPRIKKGVKRAFTLIIFGYLLRYPTYRIFDFTYVSQSQWDIFFTVDALHLIGFGLLTIILAVFFAKRMHFSLNTILISFMFILFLVSPIIAKINWDSFVPHYISAYLYTKNGSLFPLFPWLIYVLSGALLGNYLYKNEGAYFKKRFSFSLISIGAVLLASAFLIYTLENTLEGVINYWLDSTALILLRVGYVILVCGIMAFIARKFNSIPQLIKDTGKNTLLLYVVHVVILYGCALFPGFNKFYGEGFTGAQTIFAAVIMLLLMLGLVVVVERFKKHEKMKFLFGKNSKVML